MAAYATHCGVHGRTKCFGWPSGFGRKALRGFSGRRDDPLCHCGNTAGVWMIHYANRRRPQGATGTQRPRPAPDPRRAMPPQRLAVRASQRPAPREYNGRRLALGQSITQPLSYVTGQYSLPNRSNAKQQQGQRQTRGAQCRRSALRCACQSWQPASEQKQSAVCAAEAQCHDRLQGNATGCIRLKTRAGANATAIAHCTTRRACSSRCASTYAPAADAQWLSADEQWLGYMYPRI